MRIGIDASRAFLPQRTGIEEYSYQVIKNLVNKLEGRQVVLYVSTNYELNTNVRITNKFPKNWRVKVIKWPRFWTQIGLSLEMLFNQVDILFVPSHTVPFIHPKNTIVTIHGLEYEIVPKAYSFWERLYMRFSIKNSCRWAKKIIAVSNNTKKDLVRLYNVPEEKIEVIYEGINSVIASEAKQSRNENEIAASPAAPRNDKPYLLFIGRLEERKNIIGIIKAFEILKEKYKIPHKLVLAGKPGFGYEAISYKLKAISCRNDIIETGYISEEEKNNLLQNADVFLFPTFYEGFGLPILGAQNAGVPVVASNNSSIIEITSNPPRPLAGEDARRAGEGKEENSVILVNPQNPQEIADATHKLISDNIFRNDIIEKGYQNAKRFSWDKCAESIEKVLMEY